MKTPAADPSFQAFQVYPDWELNNLAITAMSAAGEGCYWRLKILQWRAITLPADPNCLRRLTKASEKEWKAIWPEIAPLFPLIEDGTGRRNPEQYALYLERVEFLEIKRANGGKGGRPKKAPSTEPEADQNQHESEPEPNAAPDAKLSLTKAKPSGFDSANRSESPMSVSLSVSGTNKPLPTSSSSSLEDQCVDATSVKHCVLLATAANCGMSEAMGSLQEVVVHSTGWSFVRDCADAAVPLEFALAQVYAKARTLDKWIRHLSYFTSYVLEKWTEQQARIAAAQYTPAPINTAEDDRASSMLHSMARREAAKGVAQWVEYCTEQGIPFETTTPKAENVA